MGKVLRRLAGVATVASVGFFLGLCGMWVRSHAVRDYGWVWAPWPGDSSGRRWVKLDGDSGGGQVEVSWRVWTQGEREALRGRNELAGARAYHRTFAEGPRRYARSDPPTFWNRVGFKWFGGATHSSVCSVLVGGDSDGGGADMADGGGRATPAEGAGGVVSGVWLRSSGVAGEVPGMREGVGGAGWL
jgi:hypothetical protein